MNRQNKLNKWIVLWSAIGVSVVLGLLYVWSVISKGLQDELHWTNTQASLPYTVFTVFMAIGFFTSGRIQDKRGPRICVAACAILMGIGLVFSGLFTTPWMVVIGFGVITGFGVGAGNAASLAPSLKWFPFSKKGMVSGAVLAGIGFSAVIYSPASNYLMGTVGVANSFTIFGVVSFAIIFVLSFNMYDPPYGYDREKGMIVLNAPPEASEKRVEEAPVLLSDHDMPTRDMFKTRNFYLLFITFAISSASGLMIISQAAKITQVQVGWEGGFLLVIVMSLFNTLGRFLGGTISDKLGRTNTLKIVLVIQAINMFMFGHYASVPMIALGILVQGFCYGSIFSVMPALTSDLYGLKNFGANYGTVFLAWGVGGIIGPMTAARAFDTTGDFYTSYLIACALSIVALVLVFLMRNVKRPGLKTQESAVSKQ